MFLERNGVKGDYMLRESHFSFILILRLFGMGHIKNAKGQIDMNYRERITANPEIMLGKPIIKGTRITVESILRKLAEGMNTNEILEAYPHLKKEDIMAVLSYSADVISKEEMIAS